MKKWIFIVPAILILILLFIIFGFNGNNSNVYQENRDNYQKVRLVLTTSGTDVGINTMVARKLASLVKEESGGNVIIEVYPNDQLAGGNTTKGVNMLYNGAIDLAVYTSGTLSTLDPRMSVATLPWTFANYQEASQIIENSGGAFYEKTLSNHGLIYLGAIHNGFRQISNNRNPVRTPEDLIGMRIRILPNEGYKLFFQLFNAVPMPMSRSEMTIALREGIIDGHDMGIFQSSNDKLSESERYITIWNYAYESYIFVANSKTFDRLEPKTQEFLRQKSKEACEWGRTRLEKNEQNIRKKFTDKGVKIIELSPEELNVFKEKIRPLIDQLKEKYGDEACQAFGIS